MRPPRDPLPGPPGAPGPPPSAAPAPGSAAEVDCVGAGAGDDPNAVAWSPTPAQRRIEPLLAALGPAPAPGWRSRLLAWLPRALRRPR